MNEILYLLITALASFAALFVIAKILGKRQVAQLEFVDYIIGISIGSIAAEMATDVSDKPIYYYLIAMALYVLLDYIINLLGNKTPAFKHFFKGRPLMIIYEGKIDYKMLKKSKLSVNDLVSLAREQGYFDLSEIEYAVFENSGKLSVLPKGEFRPTVAEDLKIKIEEPSLPFYLVADGRISFSSLRELGKDKAWLFKKLKIKDKKGLKNIILATFDEKNDKIFVNYKKE